jgi:hypothetical protein
MKSQTFTCNLQCIHMNLSIFNKYMKFTFTYIVNGLLIYHHYLYVSTNVNKY